jgi:hypothetical protein
MTEDQTRKRRRRVNGEGSVYKRSDGYWVGALDVPTTSGARKRVVVYGKTLAEAREKMANTQQNARSGIPIPDKVWKLSQDAQPGDRLVPALGRLAEHPAQARALDLGAPPQHPAAATSSGIPATVITRAAAVTAEVRPP